MSDSTSQKTTGTAAPIERRWKLAGWWRWLLVLSFVGLTMYLLGQDSSTSNASRVVRGDPRGRELTIVMNTFKRYDYMTG